MDKAPPEVDANDPEKTYADLGSVQRSLRRGPSSQGPALPVRVRTRETARKVLRFTLDDEQPRDLRKHRLGRAMAFPAKTVLVRGLRATHGGWFLLKPAGASKSCRAFSLCDDHGHYQVSCARPDRRWAGWPTRCQVRPYRKTYYSGRASPMRSREGFAVLVYDTFLWASRKFPIETMRPARWTWRTRSALPLATAHRRGGDPLQRRGVPSRKYQIAKYLNLLGTSFAAVSRPMRTASR